MVRPSLRQWLREGPFTLALSSGFFGFFAHAGMLRALEDAGIAPARVTGSSAGALAGGLWAAGVSAQTLTSELRGLSRRDFWDPGLGPGLLRGRLFRERVQALLPVPDFDACRTPVAISVFDVVARRTRVLSHGPLVTAIQASCSVPLLFHPVWVDGRACVDGGVLDRPALAGVGPDERVLCHHLTSRVPTARGRRALQRDAPRRKSLVTLICEDLPRVDPFHLPAGRRAIELAAFATLRALTRPIGDGLIREA